MPTRSPSSTTSRRAEGLDRGIRRDFRRQREPHDDLLLLVLVHAGVRHHEGGQAERPVQHAQDVGSDRFLGDLAGDHCDHVLIQDFVDPGERPHRDGVGVNVPDARVGGQGRELFDFLLE